MSVNIVIWCFRRTGEFEYAGKNKKFGMNLF